MRSGFLAATTAVAVTGCALFLDFDGPDTSEPVRDGGPPSTDAGSAFRIASVSPAPLVWQAGGRGTVHVVLTRAARFDDAIALVARGLPTGVTAKPATIAAGATEGDLELTADRTAHAGSILRGTTILASAASGVADERAIDLEIVGAPGGLDETFGDAGTITAPFHVNGATLDGDAIILVGDVADGGGPALARLSPAGALDAAFAAVALATLKGAEMGSAVVADDAGYIVATQLGKSARLLRIDRRGDGVPSYGDGGEASLDPRRVDRLRLYETTAGETVTVETVRVGLSEMVNVERRAGDGVVVASWAFKFGGVGGGVPYVAAVHPDGRVVVEPTSLGGRRFLQDGSVDPTFGSADAGDYVPVAMTIVPGGYVLGSATNVPRAPKLAADGSLDLSYGQGGFAPVGAIALAGADGGGVYGAQGVAVTRISASGQVDPTFVAPADSSDYAVGVLVQRDGKVVVVGSRTIHRYWP